MNEIIKRLNEYYTYITEKENKSNIPQRNNASCVVKCNYCENEYDETEMFCCCECENKFKTAHFIYETLKINKLPNNIPPEIWINIISYLIPN